MIKKCYRSATRVAEKIIPNFIKMRVDAEKYSIIKFMKFVSKEVKKSDKVLDAGAGSCPYKKYVSHANYESTDFEDIFKKKSKKLHNFLCSLEDIPKPNNSYDVVVNTQVLQHVEEPQKVINELYRILKPGGKLFLTAPQGWGIHAAPYHFFNFTNFGLKSLFEKAGFKIVFIKPRGGIFWYLGKRISSLPSYILFQYLPQKKVRATLIFLILFPLYLILLPFWKFLIPLFFFYIDKLDKKQDYTLGYSCYCIKN